VKVEGNRLEVDHDRLMERHSLLQQVRDWKGRRKLLIANALGGHKLKTCNNCKIIN
jgi:hypothetical protein